MIKIYTSQGQNELALQSCAVILGVNPRDEEALSVRLALGGSLEQQKKPQRPDPPVLAESTTSAPSASTAPDLPVSTSVDSDIASTDAQVAAMERMETALGRNDQTTKRLVVPKPDSQAVDTVGTPPPSPHAEVVAQLETWLRTIESRRHDRDTTNESSPPNP